MRRLAGAISPEFVALALTITVIAGLVLVIRA